MSHLKWRYLSAAAILVASLGTLLALDLYGRQSRAAGRPVSPEDLPVSLVTLSRPSEALHHWKSRGYHGRIVVAVTGKWQPVMVRDEDIDRASFPLQLRNIARQSELSLTDDNVLFVASMTGIARRVITILPEEGYRSRREYSKTNKTFIEKDGSFTVYHRGFARDFTTLPSFRPGKEPVLLYIEGSYREAGPLRDVLKRLGERGLVVDNVVYCPDAKEQPQPGTGADR